MPKGNSPCSLCGWVNTSSSAYNTLFCWGTPYGPDYTWINTYVQPSETVIAFVGSSSASIYGSTSVNDGNWHHVAITFDGVQIGIYVDGVADSLNYQSISDPPTIPMEIVLGGTLYLMQDVIEQTFAGSAADFRIYASCLSPSRISAIYEGTPPATAIVDGQTFIGKFIGDGSDLGGIALGGNASSQINMQGYNLNMNSGSGSGGGNTVMDGGQIVQLRADNQSGAPSSPNPGQIYFDTTTSRFYGWNGSAWMQLDN